MHIQAHWEIGSALQIWDSFNFYFFDGKINDQDLSSYYYERNGHELSILEFTTHSKTQYCHNNVTTIVQVPTIGTGIKRKTSKADASSDHWKG